MILFSYLDSVNTLGEYIIFWGAVSAGALAIVGLVHFLWKKGKIITKFIEDITKIIHKVNYELTDNGGGSMKDQNKATFQLVKKMEARQSALTYLSDDCIFEIDAAGHCIQANRKLCELFGAEPNQLMGLGWLNFVKADQRKRVKLEWQNGIKFGKELTSTYTIIHGETGQPREVKYYAIVAREESGEILTVNGKIEPIHHH